MKIARFAPICVLVTVALSAFGPVARATTNPCVMFDAASVGKALGGTATGPKRRDMPNGYTGCSLIVGARIVSITVSELTSPADAKTNLKISADRTASFAHVPSVPIPNVGDGAYHNANEVFVQRGSRIATIIVIESVAKSLSDGIAVARTAHP